MKHQVLRNSDLLKTPRRRRTESIDQTSVRLLEVAVTLRRSGLLVQCFEGLGTFRDTAVEQDYIA